MGERNNSRDLGLDGRTILLKRTLLKKNNMMWSDSSGSGQGQVSGYCEHNYELSGSIKD